jgi:hypothetical protein
MSAESSWKLRELGIRREIEADAQPGAQPERPTALPLGSRRASRAGARLALALCGTHCAAFLLDSYARCFSGRHRQHQWSVAWAGSRGFSASTQPPERKGAL